jgi:hypothetical protein
VAQPPAVLAGGVLVEFELCEALAERGEVGFGLGQVGLGRRPAGFGLREGLARAGGVG